MEPLRGGRYVIRGTLGEGAQGTTFDAWDTHENRAVAIKRFDVRGAKSWKDVELAEREARVLQTLDHPLVPKYIDRFEENEGLFLVMEKIEGETVEALRKEKGPLPEEEVRRFLACADRAMTYLHGRSSPVVHRDVKPRNVIRRSDGSYVFVDFGAVSELLLRRGSSTIVGTLGYMAPEQLQGRAQASTDVYAVGATALAMLTGVDPDSLPHRGLAVDVRSALAGRASESMIGTLERMLEPDPDRRPATLAAALEALPHAPSAPPPIVVGKTREDAAVKSIRNLLWVLWGLAWVIVPVTLKQLGGNNGLVPLIMFGSLACVFIVTWHKGAVIRAILRYLLGKRIVTTTGVAEQQSIHHRIDPNAARQVRVHATELRPEEIVGDTEVSEPKRARLRK